MKCTNCDGTGKEKLYDKLTNAYLLIKCAYCNGTGKIQQTNEEWFDGLSTKEKAKWLENKMTWAAQEQGTFTAKGWEMWLKQPHKGD